jgi:class 3 adenylate cyclase
LIAHDVFRTYSLAALGEVASVLIDRSSGVQLYDLLVPQAGRAAVIGSAAWHGSVDRFLGLLAAMLDRVDAAVEHHDAALEIHQRMGACPWVARSQYDLACALLARSRANDRERAIVLLNTALDTATSIGQTKLVNEVLAIKLGIQGISSGSSASLSIDAVAAGVSIDRPDLRRHAAADGTVTVLFSDIEGYTPLNERLGDARTQPVLRAHEGLIHDAVGKHHGTVVKSEGDGYMIVFATADAALASATEIQRAVTNHDFGADVGAIRIRIGVHLGEVIRDRDDFYGLTVIKAARIATHATGGEILVSDDVQRAVRDLSVCDAKLGPSRDVELKGLSGTHRLHRIDW